MICLKSSKFGPSWDIYFAKGGTSKSDPLKMEYAPYFMYEVPNFETCQTMMLFENFIVYPEEKGYHCIKASEYEISEPVKLKGKWFVISIKIDEKDLENYIQALSCSGYEFLVFPRKTYTLIVKKYSKNSKIEFANVEKIDGHQEIVWFNDEKLKIEMPAIGYIVGMESKDGHD